MITLLLLYPIASWYRRRKRWSVLVFTTCIIISPLVIEPQVVENEASISRNKPEDIEMRQRRLYGGTRNNIFYDSDDYRRHESPPIEHDATPSPTTLSSPTLFPSSLSSLTSDVPTPTPTTALVSDGPSAMASDRHDPTPILSPSTNPTLSTNPTPSTINKFRPSSLNDEPTLLTTGNPTFNQFTNNPSSIVTYAPAPNLQSTSPTSLMSNLPTYISSTSREPILSPNNKSVTDAPTPTLYGNDRPNPTAPTYGPNSSPATAPYPSSPNQSPTQSPTATSITEAPTQDTFSNGSANPTTSTDSPNSSPTGASYPSNAYPTKSPTNKLVTHVPTLNTLGHDSANPTTSTNSPNLSPTVTPYGSGSPTQTASTNSPNSLPTGASNPASSNDNPTQSPTNELGTDLPNPTQSPTEVSVTGVPTPYGNGSPNPTPPTNSPNSSPTGTSNPTSSNENATQSPTKKLATDAPTPDTFDNDSPKPTMSPIIPTLPPTVVSEPTSLKQITDAPSSVVVGNGGPTLSPISQTYPSTGVSNPTLSTLDPTMSPTAKSVNDSYSPTASKATGPTTFTCSNDLDYRYNSERKKSCGWISLTLVRQKKLCADQEVVSACPIACGVCCADDVDFTFLTNAHKDQGCAWIAENPVKRETKYCRWKYIKKYCALSCNNCQDSVPKWLTSAPSRDPSPTPSVVSTPTPSRDPTGRPSIDLTLSPSKGPTPTTSTGPTSTPTKGPSPLPSLSTPTSTPFKDTTPTGTTKSPSGSTSCTDLIYTDFDDSEKGNVILIQFDYEIETNPSIQGSLLWDVLPNVEASLTNLLIQDLIPKCNGVRRLRSHQDDSPRRLGVLVGISSSPIDVPDGEAECQSDVAEDSVCSPIRGGVSLFLKGTSSGEAYKAQSSIKKMMDDNLLLPAHVAILKVVYISKVQHDKSDENNDVIELGEDDDTEFWKTGHFRGIMLGVFSGLFTMIAIRCVARRGTRSKNSLSGWTEIGPFTNYTNSSNSTTSADDETVITSNREGSVAQSVKRDELVVDLDIETYSGETKKKKNSKKKNSKKKDEFFDVIFDESKHKKTKLSDDTSDISYD